MAAKTAAGRMRSTTVSRPTDAGITAPYVVGSRLETKAGITEHTDGAGSACMRSLSTMGVLASKWLTKAKSLSEFSTHHHRIIGNAIAGPNQAAK